MPSSKKVCHCCNKTFDSHLLLTCCVCKNTFGNACIGLSSSEARVIASKKSINWNCQSCENIGNDINSLKSVIVLLQNEIKELKKTIKDVSSNRGSDGFIEESFEEVMLEFEERQKRKKNVIIYGLNESEAMNVVERVEQDYQGVCTIFQYIDVDVSLKDDRARVFRLGKFDPSSDRPRPLKISLDNWEDALKVLRKSKQLRSADNFSHLTIASDKTPRQSAYFRKIKAEVEKRKSDGENVELKFVKGVPRINCLN